MTSRIAACLKPPAITPSDGLPPWILLDTRVYLGHIDNATTATARTSRGHTLQVSIRFADPPALSHVCLHCPGLPHDNFAKEPHVIRSEKQFLLLHLPLNWSTRFVVRSSEYYVYQAPIPGKPPTLSRIPDPLGATLLLPQDLGIYCCTDDDDGDGEYILAGPELAPDAYELHCYSSASRVWTRKPASMDRRPLDGHHPELAHKVIPLGGSLLGWVDLWKGMLVCDVLSEVPPHDPLLDHEDNYPVPFWFVPLPGLLPGNKDKDQHLCPWMVRDVTCTNGSLRLIEVELLTVQNAVQNVVKEESTVTCDDSWFVKPNDDDAPALPPRRLVGWRFVVWNRVLSDNGWRRGCEVHARDIQVVNPSHSALLAQLGNNSLGMMNLLPSFPTLSIQDDDVVRMNCLVRSDMAKAQMISIDMRNKTLKTLEPCLPGEVDDDRCPYFPCVLSNPLRNIPALSQVVPASDSINMNAALRQVVQASNSENTAENQRLQEINSENLTENQRLQASNSGYITENQRLRSCAQEVISVPNPVQNGWSNFNLSLGPQQSFGLSDARTSYNGSTFEYSGYTRRDYDNYQRSLALQQQPDYTRPSYDNYQQFLALKQQPDYTSPSYDNCQRPLALLQHPDYTRPSYDNYRRSLALQQQPAYTRPSYDNYQPSLPLQQQPEYTYPSYDKYQPPLALHQQPAYPPNMLHDPSWLSSRSVNAHPPYPVFNTDAFGQMVHPLPLNNCHMFQPPSQAVGLQTPFSTPLPPKPHGAPTGRPVLGSRPQRPNRHSPYERPG